MKTLLIMILLHIIDDFHMQGIFKELKQKSWWLQQKGYNDLYKNDYMFALFLHALSWSIVIVLPFFFFPSTPSMILVSTILINTLIHYYTDDLKCNRMKISLVTDQTIHLMQICITWLVLTIL